MTVRVRIAPSPTGFLHVGNVRSALFNWLFARHHNGKFLLRIDDTDVDRSEQQYEDDIKTGLRWLGLDWDEGVDAGGPHGSYRQSDRFDRYRAVVDDLIGAGHAYYDDRPPELLDELRNKAQKEGKHPNVYIRRPESEATSGVVRFSVPQNAPIQFLDLVRDEMRFEAGVVDDFVILRSNGTPTYHLASVVDDVDYEISHVIRGEDLLSSTPKHILLTRAMGADPATYAHLPLLFGPDGKKLSKRHGDTSLKAYRAGGYLPEAMFNYLSLLGWSYDSETTIFSVSQAVERFDLDGVSKNPAVFDVDKLQWMNGEYIRAIPAEDFAQRARPLVEAELGHPPSESEWSLFREMSPLLQERVRLITEVGEMSRFLFVDDVDFDEQSWSKVMSGETSALALSAAIRHLTDLGDWTVAAIEAALRAVLEETELNPRKGWQPLRVAVTGSQVSPPLFESMAALGRGSTLRRLSRALSLLGEEPEM
ncbi:MAG TPA: glutamate--tRNA ligase [Acidimicrobiia bacterium]|nr:glutamate--tRNA ligase [Acidimicrobiia bacterium]